MPDLCSFDYAVIRIVPRVEREEFLNAGAILYCREWRYLDARIKLDSARLAALAPELEEATVRAHLEIIPLICAGGSEIRSLAELSQVERFRWLTSPSSTVVQTSLVHSGLCSNPEAALDGLLAKVTG
jgi:hypothetical protein